MGRGGLGLAMLVAWAEGAGDWRCWWHGLRGSGGGGVGVEMDHTAVRSGLKVLGVGGDVGVGGVLDTPYLFSVRIKQCASISNSNRRHQNRVMMSVVEVASPCCSSLVYTRTSVLWIPVAHRIALKFDRSPCCSQPHAPPFHSRKPRNMMVFRCFSLVRVSCACDGSPAIYVQPG